MKGNIAATSPRFKQEDQPTPSEHRRPVQRRTGRASLVLNAISDHIQEKRKQYQQHAAFQKTPTPTRKAIRDCLSSSSLRAVTHIPSGSDGRVTHLETFRTSCRVHRAERKPVPARSEIGESRGVIDSFSRKSQARLRHVAANCFPLLVSQFCLTYDNTNIPKDGRETKRHLQRFLNALRRKVPLLVYLWILEFQNKNRNGVPHYHLFLSCAPSKEFQEFMAKTWNKITKGSGSHLKWHNHHTNFINWDMGKGSYVCKYLEKSGQKMVPAHFENVGRFWGSSHGLVPPPEVWTEEDVLSIEIVKTDKLTGEENVYNFGKMLYRILRRHHEASIRYMLKKKGISKKARSRLAKQGVGVTNLPSGGMVARQVQGWFYREDIKEKGLELF